MKNFFEKIKKRRSFFILVFLVLFFGVFLLALPVDANIGDKLGDFVTQFIGWLFSAAIWMLGVLLMLLVRVLVYVASIQNFIDVPAVTMGWSMLRDLANMFFIVILLVIAFATILRIEKYNYKKWLPKLILMAVLINYSKMICGVLIDIAQVIMLSFVNSFKSIGGTNISYMLGISDWQSLKGGGEDGEGITNWEIIASYFLATIYTIVSIVVIGTMLLVLVMRIVMIWIYVVLSPLAFLLGSFPGGEGHAGKWWKQFTDNLVVGPVLAFFIWLSFSVVNPSVQGTQVFDGEGGTKAPNFEPGQDEMADGGFGKGELMIQFIVSIGLLIGGLKVSQEIGGAAGSIAGKGMARLNKMSVGAQNLAKKGAIGAAKSTGKFVGRQALGGGSRLLQKMGGDKNRFGLRTLGDIGQDLRADIKTSRKKAKVEKRQKFLKNIGFSEKSADKYSEYLKDEKVRKVTARTSATAKGVGIGAAIGTAVAPGVGTAIGATIGGAIGYVVSHTKGRLKNAAIKKRDNAYQEREVAENDLKAANTPADKENAQKKYNKANKKYEKYKKKAKSWEESEYQSTITTQKAAAKISKEPKSSRELIKALSEDPGSIKRVKQGTYYGVAGQDSQQFHNMDKLAADTPEGDKVRKDYSDWLKNDGIYKQGNIKGFDDTSEKDIRAAEDLMKGIAAYKSEGNDSLRLSDLIVDLDREVRQKFSGDTVKDYEKKVKISYRRDDNGEGQVYDKDFKQSDLEVNSFAQGEEGKKFIGVNFDNLKKEKIDIDTKAYGGHIQEVTPDIRTALLTQVVKAKGSLEQKKKSGSIKDKDYNSQMSDLNKTEERLNDKELKNISLVNTNHPKFTREQKMTSLYHEEIHSAGMMNEDITEDIAKLLMDKKLYGRNAKTGGRHAFEVGQIALKLENEGGSREDIAKAIEKEIENRNNEEAKSRAERVIGLEKGEKETASQEISSYYSKNRKQKKDSTINMEEERNELKEKMNSYRQIVSEGSKQDESGKSDENKVKIGQEGINKLDELTKALNRLESLKQNKASVNEKINTHTEKIKEAETNNNPKQINQHTNSLNEAKKEKEKIDDRINIVSQTIYEKKENIEKDVNLKVDEKKKSSKGDVDRVISEKKTNDYDPAQLESMMDEFSKKFEKDLSNLDKGGKKNPLVVNQVDGGPKFDLANFLRFLRKALKAGHDGVIKSVNAYNKVSNEISKKVILSEIKDQLDK